MVRFEIDDVSREGKTLQLDGTWRSVGFRSRVEADGERSLDVHALGLPDYAGSMLDYLMAELLILGLVTVGSDAWSFKVDEAYRGSVRRDRIVFDAGGERDLLELELSADEAGASLAVRMIETYRISIELAPAPGSGFTVVTDDDAPSEAYGQCVDFTIGDCIKELVINNQFIISSNGALEPTEGFVRTWGSKAGL